MIERDGDGFSLSHATGNYLVEGWEDSGPQSDKVHHRLIHFGVHRRMRMSDVKEGDRVRYRGRDLIWEYPRNGAGSQNQAFRSRRLVKHP